MLFAGTFALSAHAAAPSPVGVWKTFDDATHQAKSLIRISTDNGTLSGHIIKLFPAPGDDPDPHCMDCTGARHNQPVLGMLILWDMHRDGATWDGGEILDPESGSIYQASLHLHDAGVRLEVRGYIGVPLLGRSQEWLRVAPKFP